MKHAGIIIIGAAIGAYLLFAPKSNSEGGSGGSLNIPNLGDMLGSSSVANPAQDNSSFQISDTILAAMANNTKKSTYSNLSGGAAAPTIAGINLLAPGQNPNVFGGSTTWQVGYAAKQWNNLSGGAPIPSLNMGSSVVTKKASATIPTGYNSGGGTVSYSGGWGAVANSGRRFK